MSQIKCTYEDCFRRFKTEQDMIKHKVKEPSHSYCKKCDQDCGDDLAYLIHQIGSSNHIICPIDGLEFQSKSGRDSHVEICHPQKQNLACAGCNENFGKASQLMFHIENDECKVIRLEDFERQRAETQIQKDAWEGSLDQGGGSHLPSHAGGSDADTNGGVSLLDGSGELSARNWTGNRQPTLRAPLQPAKSRSYITPRPAVQGSSDLSHGLSNLTLDKFPVLPSSSNPSAAAGKAGTDRPNNDDDDDLLDWSRPEQRITPSTWNSDSTKPASTLLFEENKKPFSNESASHIGVMDSMSELTTATRGTSAKRNVGLSDTVTDISVQSSIPGAAKAPSTDPNAAHVHVASTRRILRPIAMDPYNYFHSLEEKFICPGHKCGRRYDTPEAFSAHLLTGAHVGGRTQCPSCLRKFNTTSALISHCESGNKRCNIRKSANYNQVMRELTGGLIGTDGFLGDGSVRYVATDVHDWSAPAVTGMR